MNGKILERNITAFYRTVLLIWLPGGLSQSSTQATKSGPSEMGRFSFPILATTGPFPETFAEIQ
jgi:hypothetical protein